MTLLWLELEAIRAALWSLKVFLVVGLLAVAIGTLVDNLKRDG
jgi:hypothetical protein